MMQYVICHKQAISFILGAGPKGYRAFDENGRPIGLFGSAELAVRAVYAISPWVVNAMEGGRNPAL